MGLGSLTNKGNALIVDYYTAGYTNSVIFCQNTRDILAGFSTGSVSATECSFSSSTPGGSVQGNVTWDNWNYCGGSFSMILSKISGSVETSSDYDKALKNYIQIMNEIQKERKLKTETDPKKYTEAFSSVIKQFKEIIKNNPGSNDAKSSIGHIASIYRMLEEFTALEDFVKEIMNDPKTKSLRFHALRVLVPSYINQNNFTRSIELTDQIINEYPDDPSVIEMIYSKGLVYKYYLKDENSANEMFRQVINISPEHIAAVFAMAELGMVEKNIDNKKTIVETTSNEIEIQNYPNPFNPSTTISYTIPEDGKVLLKVFDVLGREVTTLLDGFSSAGKHSVVWDGSTSASGVYFYSVTFKGKTLNKKMLLVK
jgi:tetratricopeptide (TPR) repeat protein